MRVARACELEAMKAARKASEARTVLEDSTRAHNAAQGILSDVLAGWFDAGKQRGGDPGLIMAWTAQVQVSVGQERTAKQEVASASAMLDTATRHWSLARAREDVAAELVQMARSRERRDEDERSLATAEDLSRVRKVGR